MYDISDRRAAIRELQRHLLEIAYTDLRIPKVIIDGDYSDRTAEAVLRFQNRSGIAPSGIVDYITWNAIAREGEENRRLREMQSELYVPSTLPLEIGAVGHPVLMLQSIIGELTEFYPELPRIAPTGSYRNGTAYAVGLLQRKYGLPETGITDQQTWARIMLDGATRERLAYELNR